MTDFANWLGAQPDALKSAYAEQSQKGSGIWLTRALMVPAVFFGISFAAFPISLLYWMISEALDMDLSRFLVIPGAVFTLIMVLLDRWDSRSRTRDRSQVLAAAALMLIPVLGLVAGGHFHFFLIDWLSYSWEAVVLGSVFFSFGLLVVLLVRQGATQLLAAAFVAPGLLLLTGDRLDHWGVSDQTIFWGHCFGLVIWTGLMALAERHLARLWSLRDAGALAALIYAAVASTLVDWPTLMLAVPVLIFIMARFWRGRIVQVLSICCFVGILIVTYYNTDLSFLIKAAIFGGLAVVLLGGGLMLTQMDRRAAQ